MSICNLCSVKKHVWIHFKELEVNDRRNFPFLEEKKRYILDVQIYSTYIHIYIHTYIYTGRTVNHKYTSALKLCVCNVQHALSGPSRSPPFLLWAATISCVKHSWETNRGSKSSQVKIWKVCFKYDSIQSFDVWEQKQTQAVPSS